MAGHSVAAAARFALEVVELRVQEMVSALAAFLEELLLAVYLQVMRLEASLSGPFLEQKEGVD